MKRIHVKAFVGTILVTMVLSACSDLLDEQPRSVYTPTFFKTEAGVVGGLTSLYAHLRYVYGNAYYYNATETGTDEATYAQSADDNFKVMDMTGVGDITSTSSRADVLWNNSFYDINTASGVIENATEVGIAPSLIAEAYFFRGFDYFQLVQTFGGVPLDLGAGELMFNTSASRTSTRNTVPEVYTKAIFPDLTEAVNDLPDAPRLTGTVTKTVARLFLAKAYLTYGWWLENPNNVPTYPASDRTDPDGHNAQYYFQQAYDVATTAISNPGPYGLVATYYDLNKGSNDRNKEDLFYADHTQSSEYYNGASLTYSGGGNADNFAVWMMTWNYTNVRSSSSSTTWTPVSSVQRAAVQSLGRPWTRMAPPIGVFENTFAEKTDDSRYDGTFVTTYRANIKEAGVPGPVYNANFLPVDEGGAVLTFLDSEPGTAIDYSNSVYQSNIGVGVLPGRADFVVSPEGISRLVYPGNWKMGTYRTDNGSGLGQPNGASTRPFNIAKFSELYFIAAEAAVKGATPQAGMTARDLINVIRARAGMWVYDNNGNVPKVEDHSAAMMAATPAVIDIDYILAERSREYFAEGYRWFDLVRTQKWNDVAGSYRIGGSGVGDHTPVTYNRDIEPYLYLRPIPQGQIDALLGSDADKAAYQNPGYTE